MFDCKICSQWCLTQYICNDCYIIKNAVRLYGREKIIELVKSEFNIKEIIDLPKIIIDKEERPKKRVRFSSDSSTELYNKKDDEKYHVKELNDNLLNELKDKLTKL